ncbi:fimbrial biogenesis chaperone [Chromobacterium alticapitis]|nr:fimbria/pilus periplasmic chaperone [Chromobacterium alticapitis]
MRRSLAGLALACCAAAQPAMANVVITGTRVVYNSDAREVTIKLNNPGKEPALVQAWTDRGNAKSTPDTADAPFVIMPPIFRVDPGKSQTLRMTFTQEALPQDRESLFWLNVLDVPPLPQKAGEASNFLQIAFRSRLKIFYRPTGLPGSPDEAADKVDWKLVKNASGKGYALRGHNGSPFHVSFNLTALLWNGREYKSDGGMIAPQASEDFELNGLSAAPAGKAMVKYETINDYGAPVSHQVELKF